MNVIALRPETPATGSGGAFGGLRENLNEDTFRLDDIDQGRSAHGNGWQARPDVARFQHS